MPKKKYILWGLIIIIIVSSLIYYFYLAKQNNLTATGTIEVTKYEITPRLAGYIRDLNVKEGDLIKEKDLVCKIERKDLVEQNISDWQAVEVNKAKLQDLIEGSRKQEITVAKNNIDRASLIVEQLNKDLQRNRELYKVGAVSKQDLDKIQKEYDVANKDYQIAKENYDLVVEGTRHQEIIAQEKYIEQLIATAQANQSILADTNIYSPATGVVISKNFENNEYINQGQSVITLADLDDCWVKVYISTMDLSKVYLSQEVNLTVDAYPDVFFKGIVININDEAEFTPRESLTKEERTNKVFAVKIQIPNEQQKIKAGMIADVIFDDKDK